jgi:3-hydroxyacyl-[acyl-carrier protein] dehydratase/trans-2-decenoyl-[acyl-carrier protein] isomerase
MNKEINTYPYEKKSSYSKEDLILCGEGKMFGPGNAKLPLPPMLMFDRIVEIKDVGGKYAKGIIHAELDIDEELWFFLCHFIEDPVMPGCLGLDAIWQLIGFFLGWNGGVGRGRALGCGEVKFFGQVTPSIKKVSYQIDIKRVMTRKISLGIGDAVLLADDKVIYSASDLRVGLFKEMDALS